MTMLRLHLIWVHRYVLFLIIKVHHQLDLTCGDIGIIPHIGGKIKPPRRCCKGYHTPPFGALQGVILRLKFFTRAAGNCTPAKTSQTSRATITPRPDGAWAVNLRQRRIRLWRRTHMPGVRIELTTPASSGLRSTTELPRHIIFHHGGWRRNRTFDFCLIRTAFYH